MLHLTIHVENTEKNASDTPCDTYESCAKWMKKHQVVVRDPMLDCCCSKMNFQGFLRYALKLTPIRSPWLPCKQDVVCGVVLCSCFLWVCPCARCYLTPLYLPPMWPAKLPQVGKHLQVSFSQVTPSLSSSLPQLAHTLFAHFIFLLLPLLYSLSLSPSPFYILE